MNKIPIGLIIKDLVKQKDLDITQLSKQLGIARNTVYQIFTRTKLSDEDLAAWCNVLEVTQEDLLKRQKLEALEPETETLPDNYLMMYVKQLEDRVAEQAETIKVLLKKSEAVPFLTEFAPNASFFR